RAGWHRAGHCMPPGTLSSAAVRVAILSDVHGNTMALRAVLADLAGQADLVVANGDIVAYGPSPAETLDLMRSLPNVQFVSGNNDRNLVERRWEQPPADGWEAEAFANLRWTAERIGPEGLEFLATWPFERRLPLRPAVLVVHACPFADNVGMFPWTTDSDLRSMVDAVAEDVIVCGHTHLLMDRNLPNKRVISDGSAGFPFDRDCRPSYIVLDDGAGQLRVEVRRVAYNVDAAVRDVAASDAPFGQVIAYQMRHAALMPKHQSDYLRQDLVRYSE
ncbi:MAG: metallophosphoesterase family protein, partial [Chloroflexota bacterium]